ncbi:TolC family protein [Salinisphaera sp. Q1T1-3]|uniref:TolC family protein n=1 Tax=Salinisphaera sp. Q1T1-3 TaxID=2321229 RepID=UPI000E715685|nr:TolC family protein [Salinisphaera sp. Q1T1-3]RJS93706.1 TolC family protein [Salinisphaera sp. Q1T1-3]
MFLPYLRPGACALGLGLALWSASASALTQIPQPLTLAAALDWAAEHNPTLRAARIDIERRTGQAIHADVAVPSNPRVQIGAGQRRTPAGRGTDLDITLSQTFWIAGQGALREAAASHELGAARDRYRYLLSATSTRVRHAFLSVLLAERAVSTADRVQQATRRIDGYARRRLDAGAGTQLEANAARLGLRRAEALQARARRQRARARFALDELLGIAPTRRLDIVGRLRVNPADLPDRQALLSRALRQRRDLQAAAGRVAAARKRLALADRQIIPNLEVFGFYRRENSGRGEGPAGNGADILGGGISFELPLLHRYQGERRQAAAELDARRLAQDNLQRAVRLQVLRGLSDYETAREEVRSLDQAVMDAAQQSLALTRRAFAAGEVGAPAITAAQNSLMAVRREYLDALGRFVQATTDIERATGGLVAVTGAPTPHAGD